MSEYRTPAPGTADARAGSGATIVELERESAEEVRADEVSVRQGGIGRAWAKDVHVSQGGIGFARADRVSIAQGGLGGALAGEVHVRQGLVTGVVARDVHLGQAYVRSIFALTVRAERPTGVLFMVARNVEGNVRVLLDWRGALAFGAAFGLVSTLVRFRLRRGS
jgi:hypothetical protein